jgi:hypothetical protein
MKILVLLLALSFSTTSLLAQEPEKKTEQVQKPAKKRVAKKAVPTKLEPRKSEPKQSN